MHDIPVPDPTFTLDPRLAESSRDWGVLDGWLNLRLADDSRWPWLLLVPLRDGAVELNDVDHRALFDTAARVATALKRATGMGKTNIATIGNVVAQFHLHIVARAPDDPNWPAPIWGYGTPVPYERDAADVLREKVFASMEPSS